MSAKKGAFITIEGGDGSGKSTLLSHIHALFDSLKIRFIKTREPGGTPLAEEIREMLLRPGNALAPMAELFLYEAARAEHVAKIIRPAIENGTTVLCDRFTHSSLAYQGVARGLGLELVQELNQKATESLEPDLVIWLKIDPEEARLRIASRKENQNRLDTESLAFHKKVHDAFSNLARSEPQRFIVLDATQAPEAMMSQLSRSPLWSLALKPLIPEGKSL